MRQFATAFVIIIGACALGLHIGAPTLDAEQMFAHNLDSTAYAAQTGNYAWLEEHGIGIELDIAPQPDGPFPHLIAGSTGDASSTNQSLWELGPQGFTRFQAYLESRGGTASRAKEAEIMPQYGVEFIAAKQASITFEDGQAGVIFHFKRESRYYALLAIDSSGQQEVAESDAEILLSQSIFMPAHESGAVSPLLNEGTFAANLSGWKRNGKRFFKKSEHGWMAMRLFQVSITEQPSLILLQESIESKLSALGYKRSDRAIPQIAKKRGFIGEYFKGDNTVQRIVYAQLKTCWLVGLLQSSDKDRNALKLEAEALGESIVKIDIDSSKPAISPYFSRVRTLNLVAWKDGPSIKWGVLFNGSQEQPVLWRQKGIKWSILLQDNGQKLRDLAGTADSSRTLNPLIGAGDRAIKLPNNFKGELKLSLTVHGLKTSVILKIE